MDLNLNLGDYRHRVIETVRFSETDMLGHVNNTVFGIYFEIGRSAFLSKIGFYKQVEVSVVIVKTEIHFKGMIFWPGQVEIGTRVTETGRSSFSVEQILVQEDRVVGGSISAMVVIDPATSRATPMSDIVRSLLAA
jgi:acyl-CoA thioester hydrolase